MKSIISVKIPPLWFFQESLSSVYRHTTLILKVLVWKKENSHGKEKVVDKRGETALVREKTLSFVLKQINGILQPILKLLQILKVTLNSLEKACQLMLS